MELREPMEVTIWPFGLDRSYVQPEFGTGVAVFARGPGSSHFSSRNRFVAEAPGRVAPRPAATGGSAGPLQDIRYSAGLK